MFLILYTTISRDNLCTYRILYKPNRKVKFNILRAPYKNKIAQNSYAEYRYNYVVYFVTQNVEYDPAIFEFLIKMFKCGLLGTNINFIKSMTIIKNYKLQIV